MYLMIIYDIMLMIVRYQTFTFDINYRRCAKDISVQQNKGKSHPWSKVGP